MNTSRINLLILITAAFVAVSGNAFAEAEADLLIAYDASHATAVGGQDNAQVLAANGVAGCNAINDRSGTGARMRIVGYHQAAQNLYQTTSKGGFVNWMQSYDSHMTDVVDAGNARGADLVAWICVSTSDGAAAVAQQPGRYSAFDPGSFWSTIIAHETGGHNYACDHRGGRENPKTVMLHNYCGGGAQGYFSNPNLWLNGVRLQGEGSCLGTAVNGGDNAYLISTTAQGRADAFGRVVVAPNLGNVVLRWCFTNSAAAAPASTTNLDLISGAPAVVRGNGATYTGKALRIPGGTTGNTAANSISAYIDLPNGIISSRTNITIEIWATPLSAPNWARVLDFGRTTQAGDGLGADGEYTGTPGTAAPGSTSSSDDIMLAAAVGTDINVQRLEAKLNGGAVALDSGLATTAGVQHHYAITFTDNAGGGRWQWYRDGDAVAFLDVNFHLADIEDVNNWLGRSLWSGDSMANNDYAEVRISSVAMSRDEIFANCALGPNRTASTVTLTADDPIGSASFSAAGNWSDGLAPSAEKTYETYRFRLRTPADGTSRTFAGQSLTLTGGGITWKGTSSSSLTGNNLTFSGDCELIQAGSGTWTLGGNITVKSEETMVRAANGPVNLTANLSGNGNLLHVNNAVTLSGNNSAFTGKTIVGDGRFSSIVIDSEARLGGNPATFTADQFTLNRGVLYNTGNLTLDDANRGIRIGVSAGIFNVAPGTTLTLAVPLSSPTSGNALVTTPLFPNPVSGMLIKDNTGTLVLTHPNNSYIGEIVINGGSFTVQGAGRLNNGDHHMPIVNNGTLTFNTTANQILSGVVSGSGPLIKTNTGTLTLFGANTMSGAVTINGGTVYANNANAATNRAFSYVSSITVNSGATLRSSANALFGWDGTQEKPITVNAGGTLTANGGLGSDVGVGTVTLAGGMLATLAGGATDFGSFRFDNAGDKLAVTQNSTVSAVNVKFANGAAIDVAAARTLNFTGTITDASAGGVSSLVKSGGAGTLVLSGANTYTGTTAVSAGTMLVNGSIGSGAVTVASGATLGGSGTIGGAVTVQSGGTIAPGTSIGKLTVSNSVTLQSGSATVMEISKTPQTNDQLRATGALSFGGTLTVINLGGALQAGDKFILFSAAGYAGAFNGITLPALSGGLVWDTSQLWVDGSIAVVVPPNIAERIYALTVDNQLIAFDSATPGTILSAYTVGGLQANEKIVGIDFWGGTLYGLGDMNRLYTINRANGVAGLVGAFSPVMNGEAFGFEAEPGGLRLVSNLDQNLLLAYADGAATTGATLNGSPNPAVTGLAYHPGNGQRYVADYSQNTIGLLNVASGLVSTIGLAGIDFSRHNGFEVSPNPGNTAYLVSPAASSDPAANLYKVDLTTGAATLVGLVGLVGDDTLIRGLAVGPGYVNLSPTSLTLSLSADQLTLSWPADHTGWSLQTQTNSRAIGLGTNWFEVTDSTTTNSVLLPIDMQNGSVFYRLIYP